ncbi:MAG: aspartate kinase [Chitinophagaceae bacterium]|nr:aspartate kinase [Chitinophagaceae bacterium]
MLSVEKIGGTSMSAMDMVLKNIICYNRSGAELYNRIFVVSAYAGVTNWLLENKKTGEPGIYHRIAEYKDFHQSLYEITERLQAINKQYESIGLNLEVANDFIEQRIYDAENYLENLANILASGYVSDESILQAAREILASIGEMHSAFNFVNILQNNNIHATFIDLSGFYDHEPYTISERIENNLKGIAFDQTICVVTGYAKGKEGIMREFDRGYSDVTFSKVAVTVKPAEAIIHKEYHLSSADPAIVGVDHCVPIGFTNYDIADQLADIGMEAIHPKASKPLEINNINLRIKNTFQPEHPGTLITKEYLSPVKKIEVITGTDKVLILDIYDPLMVGSVGSDLKIMELFKAYDISYIFKTTSANGISMVIWERSFKKEILEKLQHEFEKVMVEKVAIVSVIGSNINEPHLLANVADILTKAEINILSVGFSYRKVNLQLIVARNDFKKAICQLNNTILLPQPLLHTL